MAAGNRLDFEALLQRVHPAASRTAGVKASRSGDTRVVSELATNAVLHARTSYAVVITRSDAAVRVKR